jgi:hypothetical protein
MLSRQKIARRPRPAEDIDKPAAFAHTKKRKNSVKRRSTL